MSSEGGLAQGARGIMNIILQLLLLVTGIVLLKDLDFSKVITPKEKVGLAIIGLTGFWIVYDFLRH